MAKTIDQIAKEELKKRNSSDSEFGGTTTQKETFEADAIVTPGLESCLLYTSPSPRD